MRGVVAWPPPEESRGPQIFSVPAPLSDPLNPERDLGLRSLAGIVELATNENGVRKLHDSAVIQGLLRLQQSLSLAKSSIRTRLPHSRLSVALEPEQAPRRPSRHHP